VQTNQSCCWMPYHVPSSHMALLAAAALLLPAVGCSIPSEASLNRFPRTPISASGDLLSPHPTLRKSSLFAFAPSSTQLMARSTHHMACPTAATLMGKPLAGKSFEEPRLRGRGTREAGKLMMTGSVAEAVAEDKGKEASDFQGFHHVELWVGNALQAASFFIARMGFEPVAYKGLETGSRDVVTHVVRQGRVVFAFSSPLEPNNMVMGDHQALHGDGVRDVSMLVSDCKGVYQRAVEAGAEGVLEPHEQKDEHGSVISATIRSYGDVLHTFVEKADYDGPFLPGFQGVEGRDPLVDITPSPNLLFIDHVVGNQPDLAMNDVCEWYTKILGFKRFWSVDDSQVVTEFSSLRSVVMCDPSETVKMPINEPANGKRKSQIQEFIDYYGGPGVQHIALRTDDILHTVEMLRKRGAKFLKVPTSYYEDLRARLGDSSVEVAEDLARVEQLNLLCDFDDEGYLLQIFMRPVQDRPTLFLEVIQRRGHEGFGVGNFKALFEAIEREQQARGNL